jgi:agmatinase
MRTERDGLFAPPLTFAQTDYSQDFAHADIAILGLPFDCGGHPTRFGARLGPTAIRQQSILALELLEDAGNNPIETMRTIDAGNVNISAAGLANIDQFYDRSRKALAVMLEKDCLPICLGGDGAVALPQMQALQEKYPDLICIHFDAHTDAYPLKSNDHFDNATPFTHAAQLGLIDVKNSIHIGTRAPVNADKSIAFTRDLGYRVLPWKDIARLPAEEIADRIKGGVGSKPVFLCFDMDFFDPSAAPGVATPTPGGPTSFEGLEILRACRGLNIVGADVNTVSPDDDPSGITAQLAATIVLELLSIIG